MPAIVSPSPYDTFDQAAGNLYEWNEALLSLPVDPLGRGVRDSSWSDMPFSLKSSYRLYHGPTNESSSVGFRVATKIPEPSTGVLAAFAFIGLAAWGWRKKRGAR